MGYNKEKWNCTCEAGYRGEVIHCPLHAAALDMYEALEMIARGERRDGNYDRNDAIAFLGLARQALAKVESK